jgi:hypothetical protein
MPVASVTVPHKTHPTGMIVAVGVPVWTVVNEGVATVAAAVEFVGAVAGGGTVAPTGEDH